MVDRDRPARQTDTAGFARNFLRGSGNIFLPDEIWNGPDPSYVGYEFQTISCLASLIYRLTGEHT